MQVATLVLPTGLARRVRRGQVWIRARDLAAVDVPELPAGTLVYLADEGRNEIVATGYYNPHSQIRIRVLDQGRVRVDNEFFRRRLQAAWNWRQKLLQAWPGCDAFRWINSEGDGLPGLVVDVYAGYAVVQILTLGMERLQDLIFSALQTFDLRGIAEKSQGRARRQEGLEDRVRVVVGPVPDVITIREWDVRLPVPWRDGHKTGFYLDLREVRKWVRDHARDAQVLDLCAYTGAFSFLALHGGARRVVAVDSFRRGLEWADAWAQELRVRDRVEWVHADVFDFVRHLNRQRDRFDVVILDPPPLAPHRRALRGALRGYRELNRRAMRLLKPGGVLVTTSCSHHMDTATFLTVLRQAAGSIPRTFRILGSHTQPADHPAHLHTAETLYFQAVYCKVLGA